MENQSLESLNFQTITAYQEAVLKKGEFGGSLSLSLPIGVANYLKESDIVSLAKLSKDLSKKRVLVTPDTLESFIQKGLSDRSHIISESFFTTNFNLKKK